MREVEPTLADRARRLLRANGGRAGQAELLAVLFGSATDPGRWGGLLDGVLEGLADLRRADDGSWELVSNRPGLAGRPTELTFVTLASAATSADPWRARLAALAAVRVRGGQLDGTFEVRFNPGCRLPRYLTEVTGLTQAEADEAPAFGDLADELLEFLAGAPLLGLEIRAQLGTLGHELARLERPGLPNPVLDLAHLAARLGLALGKPSLPALAAALDLTHPRPYHPTTDARVAARLALKLLALAHGAGVSDPARLFAEPEPVAPGALLHPDPPAAPLGPGVYLLKAADGRVLYVGKARRLRHRLAAYHRRQLGLLRRLEGLSAAVTEIETIGTVSELEALILEARLVRQHAPPYNTQRRQRRPALFLRADLAGGTASLVACRELRPDGARYLGPFRTASGAAEALRLARALFPGLEGRARAGAADRRPLVQHALRFLSGQKREVLDRLQADQRALAALGERTALDASRALLRRALDFDLDSATICAQPLEARLLVLSPPPDDPTDQPRCLAHVIEAGHLLACFEADDAVEARERAKNVGDRRPETGNGMDQQDAPADELSIVFRWLCSLGPAHRIEMIGS